MRHFARFNFFVDTYMRTTRVPKPRGRIFDDPQTACRYERQPIGYSGSFFYASTFEKKIQNGRPVVAKRKKLY